MDEARREGEREAEIRVSAQRREGRKLSVGKRYLLYATNPRVEMDWMERERERERERKREGGRERERAERRRENMGYNNNNNNNRNVYNRRHWKRHAIVHIQ